MVDYISHGFTADKKRYTAVVVRYDNYCLVCGVAICSQHDQFSKKQGQKIAQKRLNTFFRLVKKMGGLHEVVKIRDFSFGGIFLITSRELPTTKLHTVNVGSIKPLLSIAPEQFEVITKAINSVMSKNSTDINKLLFYQHYYREKIRKERKMKVDKPVQPVKIKGAGNIAGNKYIIRKMITLFTEHPEYRDRRYDAIEKIIMDNYLPLYGKSIKSDGKLFYDIDRVFRLVQQKIEELRGKDWEKRQKKGGVGNDFTKAEVKTIESICVQMQINFK
jgi:hypothetical protein